jgi:serine/threonine-protein kinase
MGCLDEERILALVEGALAAEERASVEHHLARCHDCRTLVARAAEALLSTGVVSAGEDDGDAAPPRAPRPGERVGRYRVSRLLGSGAMGIVVAAEDEKLGREVALKLLRRDASREVRERFIREARAASAISHPGVVAVHDVLTTSDGHPVIVMDRLHGETLRERLERERRLGVAQTLQIASAIASALGAAHERGIVHRDLKPENVFLACRDDQGFELKLLDFGVAKLLDGPLGERAELTATGTIVGTPYYMAPEQAFGQRDVDARADLWSLGVIVYECLSGRRPFAADSVGQVLRLLALGELTPLAEVSPEVPAGVAALVERLLSACEERPKTAGEVLSAIHQLEQAPPLPARMWLGRRGWLLAAGFGLAALVAGAWSFDQRDQSADDPAPLAVSSSFEPVLSSPLVSTARAEAATARSAEPIAKKPLAPRLEPAARAAIAPATPSASATAAAKSGPGKLLTEPLF